MIVLNLSCDQGHHFEGWFTSRDAFGEQVTRGMVNCTHCQSVAVTALPSGPYVHAMRRERHSHGGDRHHSGENAGDESLVQMPTPDVAKQLFASLAMMARTAENVGINFPEEARRIHYNEAPARTIRGIASGDETRELLEEGIMVLPALVPPERETH
ncbi:MAG: DUF1178 family protein [Rhodocyclaceae bacterium]|nr:DUF1178 family protein [Rhodocyclaceae bacterium]MBL0076712.1 DUF1178 family protein [Rhodocyclaceae bacterium]MBP6109764.1 DUF1178 family protein [Rhodocyclaceae bacterium]MBP6278224.1 DUF1178 family protein [Rhodocyclaceae bacterium]